jgi:hypothetical protein
MTTSNGSAADELRALYGCREPAAICLNAIPAYDEDGRPTGRVAIDPEEFSDWFADGAAHFEIEDAEDIDDGEEEDR